jgi:hypothetical protein
MMQDTITAIDRASFDTNVVQAGQPILMPALVRHWPAVQASLQSPSALSDYLKSLYNGAYIDTMFAAPEQQGRHFYDAQMRGFNFERRQAPLPALLDKMIEIADDQDAMAIYAGSVPASQFVPGFALQNPNPLLPTDVEPRLWIGNRSRVAAHFDAELNIACAISGTRRFILFPPEQIANLYIGPLDFNIAGPPASLVDFAKPDFERFPKFRDALDAALIFDLEPGDALFIPPLWWHHVEATGPFNLLVNYWWASTQTPPLIPVLALAMLSIRERPLSERQAWRAYFDHYVFGHDAPSAADHIPAHARGVLGEPSEGRTQAILGFVANSLGIR